MDVIDQLSSKMEKAIKQIKEQYLSVEEDFPWLIGYSGGKDSTCTAQLVFRAIKELKENGEKLSRKVTVFSSDTLIENPLVKQIIEKNIELINKRAKELELPINAVILAPTIDNTYWVNVIGKGYPTPNTMFRWCTDRMKILPADIFVKKNIDENGEVIMVLGVREGESGTRDRVLKNHNIEGETLMKHTTMSNAYVFAPIKNFTTNDVFLYLSEMTSPWGSNNKELYFFYEESGGGECPIFLSQEDKTLSNSCGNSRMGCWCCTVVSKDKSLTGFIETGWHNELKPLLEFRSWIVTIRDNEDYRCFYRMNGSIYTKKLDTKVIGKDTYIKLFGKSKKDSLLIPINDDGNISDSTGYILVEKKNLSEYMKTNGLSFKNSLMSKIILKDSVTNEFFKIGTGPFNEKAKIEIFDRLLDTEEKYNKLVTEKKLLISDEEINEIKRIWSKIGINPNVVDDIMEKYHRDIPVYIRDSFELMNQKYGYHLNQILQNNNLDMEVFSALIQAERDCIMSGDRSSMQQKIMSIFEADKVNFF